MSLGNISNKANLLLMWGAVGRETVNRHPYTFPYTYNLDIGFFGCRASGLRTYAVRVSLSRFNP